MGPKRTLVVREFVGWIERSGEIPVNARTSKEANRRTETSVQFLRAEADCVCFVVRAPITSWLSPTLSSEDVPSSSYQQLYLDKCDRYNSLLKRYLASQREVDLLKIKVQYLEEMNRMSSGSSSPQAPADIEEQPLTVMVSPEVVFGVKRSSGEMEESEGEEILDDLPPSKRVRREDQLDQDGVDQMDFDDDDEPPAVPPAAPIVAPPAAPIVAPPAAPIVAPPPAAPIVANVR
ncbi:hypothetical protein AVEN_206673-1, partial [Araneus ventricosus]